MGKKKIGEDKEDKVWFFMLLVWTTALITIFHHTHNDFGAATISGLIQMAHSIFPFMLSLFNVTWNVQGEMYWWAQSCFQSSYKHFLDNKISIKLFLWFFWDTNNNCQNIHWVYWSAFWDKVEMEISLL